MADDADRAKVLERLEREASIARQQAEAAALDAIKPLYIDGVPCCRSCHEPLDEKRLAARPCAAYCVPCKTRMEAE